MTVGGGQVSLCKSELKNARTFPRIFLIVFCRGGAECSGNVLYATMGWAECSGNVLSSVGVSVNFRTIV
jgi:hypothetical protein